MPFVDYHIQQTTASESVQNDDFSQMSKLSCKRGDLSKKNELKCVILFSVNISEWSVVHANLFCF